MEYTLKDYRNAGIVLLFLFAICFFAGELNEPSWNVSAFDYDGQKGMGYSLNLPNDRVYCHVESYENGQLRIYGNDYNWYGKTAVNYVSIKEVADNQQTIDKNSYYYGEPTNEHGLIMVRSGGYDVFYVNCLRYSKSLPKEVRKMFHGYYGIK